MRRGAHLLTIAVLLFASTGCAARLAPLPSGAGTPFPEAATAYGQATASCREVRTLVAVLSISGRAGGNRFRAKIDGGFAQPGRVRLELPAPGKPFFTFVATGDRATLVLPRESRVLKDAPPAATLEALAGIALDPDDLRTIVTGCGFAIGEPGAGRAFDRGRAAVDVGGATAWLQQVGGAWQIAATTRGTVEVRYSEFVAGRPLAIRLRTSPASRDSASDLTLRLSQVEINQPLGDEAFQVEVPPDALPMTLDQLRQSGPLGR